MNQQLLKQNLINLRVNKGLTQKELAMELNYSDKVISKWERGESIPNVEALSEIADYYNTSIDELIGRKEESKKTSKMTVKLETIQTDSPSLLRLFFIVPFVIFTGTAFISLQYLIAPSLLLLGVALMFYSFLISKATFETQYKYDKIKVVNKWFSADIYINNELILADKTVFAINPVREVTYNDVVYKF